MYDIIVSKHDSIDAYTKRQNTIIQKKEETIGVFYGVKLTIEREYKINFKKNSLKAINIVNKCDIV